MLLSLPRSCGIAVTGFEACLSAQPDKMVGS
jgi:hypothetical protein